MSSRPSVPLPYYVSWNVHQIARSFSSFSCLRYCGSKPSRSPQAAIKFTAEGVADRAASKGVSKVCWSTNLRVQASRRDNQMSFHVRTRITRRKAHEFLKPVYLEKRSRDASVVRLGFRAIPPSRDLATLRWKQTVVSQATPICQEDF